MADGPNEAYAVDVARIDAAAEEGSFSGVVIVDVGGQRVFERSFGYAHRAYAVPNTPDTLFAIASGSKAFTALAVMRLVEEGQLHLGQTAREILNADLPLIPDGVTVEHLLSHTSGIGDYLDESDDWNPAEYVLDVPAHILTSAEAFLPLLEGHAQDFTPGDRFFYSNAGYMILAIILERVTGEVFHDLMQRLVFEPAGMHETAYLRLDDLPANAATGYIFNDGNRVNTLHLPVRGNGDGGAFTSAADMHIFWRALFDGAIVSPDTLRAMVRPRSDVPEEGMRYGLGFWLHALENSVIVEGCDAGVSFRSTHDPETSTTVTVLGNTTEGAWPVIRATL